MQAIMNTRFKLMKNQKGMTLIELLAVVVILGILAAVAGAAVVGGFDKAKTNADVASISTIRDAAQRYVIDTNPAASALGSVTISALVTNGYLVQTPTSSVDSTKTKFKLTVGKDATGVYSYTIVTDATGN